MKKFNPLIKGFQINGKISFNLNYVIDTINLEKTKSFLNEDVQKYFVDGKTIWFESSGDSVLIRDKKPIDLESFIKKFTFIK